MHLCCSAFDATFNPRSIGHAFDSVGIRVHVEGYVVFDRETVLAKLTQGKQTDGSGGGVNTWLRAMLLICAHATHASYLDRVHSSSACATAERLRLKLRLLRAVTGQGTAKTSTTLENRKSLIHRMKASADAAGERGQAQVDMLRHAELAKDRVPKKRANTISGSVWYTSSAARERRIEAEQLLSIKPLAKRWLAVARKAKKQREREATKAAKAAEREAAKQAKQDARSAAQAQQQAAGRGCAGRGAGRGGRGRGGRGGRGDRSTANREVAAAAVAPNDGSAHQGHPADEANAASNAVGKQSELPQLPQRVSGALQAGSNAPMRTAAMPKRTRKLTARAAEWRAEDELMNETSVESLGSIPSSVLLSPAPKLVRTTTAAGPAALTPSRHKPRRRDALNDISNA